MEPPNSRTRSGPSRWVYLVGVLLALGIGYGAWTLVRDHQHMARVGIAVDGSMTGRYREVMSTGRGRTTSYYPGVSFRTADGRVVMASAANAVPQSDIQPGRVVALRYDPSDPSTVRLAADLDGGPGVLPWILGGLALLVGVLSVLGVVRGRTARLRL